MDWLRRNWPDLAIGIALVAVIAGIIATLLTGGSFFPLPPTTPADTPAPPGIATPAPDPVQPAVPAVPDEAAAPPTDEAPPAPQPGVEVLAPDGSPADQPPAAVAADPDPAPASPAPAEPAAAAPPPAAPVTPDPAPAPPVVAAPAPPASAPAPAQDATAPAASTDPAAPYRVSVGAFGSAENAERQAATFRAAGFPVFTGTQGNLTIVLVGPFESEADALAVATRIRGGDFGVDPVVYRFQPDAASAAGATPPPATPTPDGPAAAPAPPPAAPAPAAPAPAAPAAPPAATPAPATATAPAGERYVQVGAYSTAQSAEPLRERLAGLGFATREIQEGGLVKLLVGPFDDAGLAAARQRLDAQGIQNFPR